MLILVVEIHLCGQPASMSDKKATWNLQSLEVFIIISLLEKGAGGTEGFLREGNEN